MHKDSINHKVNFRVSHKKGAQGETLEDDGDTALDAIPFDTTTTVQNALDIETGNV